MKVVIIDDDNLVAVSLKTIVEADPEMEVLGTGSSGEEAVRLYTEYKPDVLLMDIRMRGMTGLEAGEHILQEDPAAKILYLTTFSDDEYIMKALSIGAKGYIIKQDFDSIVPSLKAVYGGQSVFGTEVVRRLPDIVGGAARAASGGTNGSAGSSVNGMAGGANGSAGSSANSMVNSADEPGENAPARFKGEAYGLTEQETEIVECVARGLSNKEIADELFLSEGTVRNYLSNILSKLELRDRTNLAIFYFKAGGV